MSLLSKIQQELNAPKNQFNSFGKYSYRSLEDIFEGLKPAVNKLQIKERNYLANGIRIQCRRYFRNGGTNGA